MGTNGLILVFHAQKFKSYFITERSLINNSHICYQVSGLVFEIHSKCIINIVVISA